MDGPFSFYKNNYKETSRLKFHVKIFQKITIYSKFEHEKERPDRDKHFWHVFGVGVKFATSKHLNFTGSYKNSIFSVWVTVFVCK